MTLNEALLPELESEIGNSRITLERVPADKPDFAPHSKSMPLGRLAAHVAQLPEFGLIVLATPGLDFSTANFKPLPFESAAQLVQALEGGAAKLRLALAGTSSESWQQRWKLAFGGKTIFESSRFLAYRAMFLNHLIHHRAQLGVYLRMNGIPVPALYGPSADEPFTP